MISVTFLTHNRIDVTSQFIDSLVENYKHKEFEVIHVDNASIDGTPEFVKERLESNGIKLTQIVNDENLFFTKATNQCLKKFMESDNKYCFLFNNDMILASKCIKNMVDNVEAYNGGDWVWCYIPILYTNQDEFIKNEKLHNELINRHDFPTTRFSICCCLHRKLIEAIGYLDEQFDFYFSDNDYYQRIMKEKIGIYLCFSAAIYHMEGSTCQTVPGFYNRIREEKEQFFKKWGYML